MVYIWRSLLVPLISGRWTNVLRHSSSAQWRECSEMTSAASATSVHATSAEPLLMHAALTVVVENLGPVSNGRPINELADQRSRPARPVAPQSRRQSTISERRRNASYNFDGRWWAAGERPTLPGNFTVVQRQCARPADDLPADDMPEYFMMSPVLSAGYKQCVSSVTCGLMMNDSRHSASHYY